MKKIISALIRFLPRPLLQRISPLGLKVLGWFYRGKAVECPICQHTYARFLPYGRGSSARANALCPHCLSLERHRLIWVYLQEKTDFFTVPQQVLHIAPEACFIPRFEKLPHLEYITADLVSPLAQVKMDIMQMPFPENRFSVVFCNHVLEHVADDRQAMREIYRVLRPGGWAILQVPFFRLDLEETYEDARLTSPAERFRAFGQEDHVRMYGRDYAQRLASAGFRVMEDDFALLLPENFRQKHGLPRQEYIYLCKK
ncbi:MAG: class I SAM-dependent methyltransferase [Microscillaceae bacterium]